MMKNDKIDYTKTKIYKIMSHLGDKIYIGSTTKKHLCNRMGNHRHGYKQWKEGKVRKVSSFELFDEYGVENCKIILIESYSCSTKEEKNAKEAFYIQNNDCVNKIIPGRTDKQYYKDNEEKIKAYAKSYREEHKELYAAATKRHYEKNKEAVDAKQNEVINCECGGHHFKRGRARHLRTAKHIAFVDSGL
jgi:hypothetical protein